MASEIDLGGTIYISSKRAAEITGYTQDYVGQLARGGHIVAQRVSGLWYVVEQSLRDYKEKADQFKPEPPKHEPQPDLDASVSFDGKDYVSAQRASKITGYHQDYVGQLARSGKILSRQVGNRWYVDREGIVEHKRHNDELLAAVQTESVGLARPQVSAEKPEPEAVHFTYTTEPPLSEIPRLEPKQAVDAISPPSLVSESAVKADNAPVSILDTADNAEATVVDTTVEESGAREEVVNEIPIRVIRPHTTQIAISDYADDIPKVGPKYTQVVLYTAIAATVLIGLVSGYIYFMSGSREGVIVAEGQRGAAAESAIPEFILDIVGTELYYRRGN